MLQTEIFLGGTTDNDYRPSFITALTRRGIAPERLFNPVVKHWDDAAQHQEDLLKADQSVLQLYYLTGNDEGLFLSFYSLHEAVMGLYDRPGRTALVFDYSNLVHRAAKRLGKVCKDLKVRFPEAPIFESLKEAEDWLVARFVK